MEEEKELGTLPHMSCIIWDESHYLSELQLPHLSNEENNITCHTGLGDHLGSGFQLEMNLHPIPGDI